MSVEGGAMPHIPVLLAEVLTALALKTDATVIDGTFGAGGYSRAILEAASGVRVLAIDRDPDAIANGYGLVAAMAGRLKLTEDRFALLDQLAVNDGIAPVDGVVLDIGVSSMQLDQAARGFSFRQDGPLDMRMASDGPSAADFVNSESEERLADIIFHYGEERQARPIAKAIVAARAAGPILTTKALCDVITTVLWVKPNMIHPATRTFQALRIAVNDELVELVDALHAAERVLQPGGRLVVVTFHSLEDRIVKQFFAARSGKTGGSRFAPVALTAPPTFTIEGRWPVIAGDAETNSNPRARSAKLRAAIRTAAPAWKTRETQVADLAELPKTSRRTGRGKR